MSARDPETGQFVSSDSQYDDVEVVTFSANVGVEAANLDGTATFEGEAYEFEGLELVDYDSVVDRNEELVLLAADHRASTFANSTATADGTVTSSVAISASPALTMATAAAANASNAVFDSGETVGQARRDDTIDIIGRPLSSTAGAPFSDGTNGSAGSGSAGEDSVSVSMAPAEYGRFHPRDELFLNGKFRVWNVDDQGVHVAVTGQHVYGVLSD